MLNKLKSDIPTVVITDISPLWSYFQIFMLGFYELEKQSKIKLKLRCQWLFRLSSMIGNEWIGHCYESIKYRVLYRIARKCKLYKESFMLCGYVKFAGQEHKFCIDNNDAPFIYSGKLLDEVETYFKMQCPKEIDPDLGFALTSDVRIPYCDYAYQNLSTQHFATRGERKLCENLRRNVHKIKPLLIGFRQLSYANSYKALKRGYTRYLSSRKKETIRKAMCYFGNSKGPKPTKFEGGGICRIGIRNAT